MDNDTLIKVEDLCKIYNPGENEVRALDHVDLSIDKGELVGINSVLSSPTGAYAGYGDAVSCSYYYGDGCFTSEGAGQCDKACRGCTWNDKWC